MPALRYGQLQFFFFFINARKIILASTKRLAEKNLKLTCLILIRKYFLELIKILNYFDKKISYYKNGKQLELIKKS
jgi:hypothetical protein